MPLTEPYRSKAGHGAPLDPASTLGYRRTLNNTAVLRYHRRLKA